MPQPLSFAAPTPLPLRTAPSPPNACRVHAPPPFLSAAPPGPASPSPKRGRRPSTTTSKRPPRRIRVPAPPPPRSNPPPAAYSTTAPPTVPAATRARVAALVAARNHVRVVGAARGGRVRAVAEGLAACAAERALVLAPTREAALRCAAEVEAGYPAAHLVTEVGGGNVDQVRTPLKLARRAVRCVLVGTPRGVVEEFAGSESGRYWLSGVECVVMYDMEYLREVGSFQEMRKIVRLVMPTPETQVVVVMDRAEPAVLARVVPYILPAKHTVVRWFDAAVPSVERDVEAAAAQEAAVVVAEPGAFTRALARVVVGAVQAGRVLVFFPTGRLAQVYAAMVGTVLGREVLEVHSKKNARHCSRDLAAFRAEGAAVLFCSDAAARGAEIEHVPTVVQVGAPRDAEQHKARLALVENGGRFISLLRDFDLPLLSAASSVEVTVVDSDGGRNAGAVAGEKEQASELKLFAGLESLEDTVVAAAYTSWLTYYLTQMNSLSWTRADVAREAARWAALEVGRSTPPPLPVRTIKRFGLQDLEDVVPEPPVVPVPTRKIGKQGKAFSRVKHRELVKTIGKEAADKLANDKRKNRVRRRKSK